MAVVLYFEIFENYEKYTAYKTNLSKMSPVFLFSRFFYFPLRSTKLCVLGKFKNVSNIIQNERVYIYMRTEYIITILDVLFVSKCLKKYS